jgi:hypothetical protein
MKKMIFAATAAAMLLYAPLAQAAVVYDLTFTGFTSIFGSPSQVNGTGTITTTGPIGSGFENATLTSSGFKITDLDITLNLASFNLGNAVSADLTTFNGNPLAFGYLGHTPASAGLFDPQIVLTAYWPTDIFTLSDTIKGQRNFFTGTFSISEAAMGAVPEPATWAMLVLGFGGIGAMLRLARRRALVPA